MPQVQTLNNILPAGNGGQIPPDLKARLLAAQMATEQAAAPKAPYTSRTAGLVSALTGGLGGIMEGMATRDLMARQQAHQNLVADAYERSPQFGQQGAAGQPATPTSAAPTGQGGIGSDRTASAGNTGFIASIMPQAQRVAAQTGLDPRLVAAQAALESNFGKSAPGNNLFGIKGAGTPISTMESVNGQMVPTKASFASYDSPDASFDGYGKLMSGSRYAGVRGAQGLDAQLDALGKSGYATDPNYAAKVGAIARGIQAPQPAQGQTAQADMPAAGAPPSQASSGSAIPDSAALAAQNRLSTGQGSDADRATLAAYRQQQNAPAPSVAGQSAAADPGQAAPGGDLRATLEAAAAQHGGLNPDAPAPGAIPTGANGLPPGVTPDMLSPDQTPAAAPSASPYGGPPEPMQAPSADDQSLRDTLLAAAGQQPPIGTLGASVDPGLPSGTMAPGPAVDPSMLSGQADSGAAPMVPAPQSPYGGPPQPMAAPSPDDETLRQTLMAAANPVPPSALSGQADSGASNMLPSDPPLPPENPNSPFGGPPQAMTPPPVVPPTAMASAMASMPSAPPAAPLSTDHLPGFDNFDQNGQVQQSSAGANGYTGGFNDGPQGTINGNLPAPGYAAGGPAPDNFTPNPAQVALFNALQQNGMPMGGPGAPPPAKPTPQQLAAALQPSGPLPQIATQPLPAPAGLAAENGYSAPDPTATTGQKTMAPSSGPNSPAVAISNSPGPRTEPADAPAPGAIPTSAPGLPASMTPQPMGLAGRGGSDPMSASAFTRQQALASALQGGGGAQPPQPTPAMLATAMQGGSQAPAAPQGGNGQPAAAPAPQAGGQGSSGLLGGLGSIFGMGGQQPQAQSSRYPAGSAMAAYDALLRDPMTTSEELSMVASRMNPQPMKLSQGEGLVVRNPDGSFTNAYTQAPKADFDFNPATGVMTNKATGEQRQAQPPQGDFDMTRNGVMYNKRTGAITPGGGDAYTQLSPAEVAAANFPAGTHVQRGPNGELSVVNPGATADASNDMTKSLSAAYTKEPSELIQNVSANQQKVRELNALSGALQRLRQNGGTTGIGTDEMAHIQSAINTGANTLGINEPFDMQDKDVMRKINTQVAAAASKTMSTRGATNMDFAAFQKANPGLENNPQANVRMLGMLTQDAQRDVNLGQAYRDQVGQSLANKTPINPTTFDQIRQGYDADAKNHIVDPLTGQDISASARLPATPPTPGQNGQPLAGGMPNPPAGAAPTASARPPGVPQQAAQPPMQGARQAPNGNWYLPDPNRPGKYLMVQ